MRTLLALFAVAGLAASALAQGLVNFDNNAAFATPGDRLVRYSCDLICPSRCIYGAPLVGTDLVAQLYYGTQGTPYQSLTPVDPPARFRVSTTPFPGTWSGGMRTLEGTLPGQTVTLQVRVWDTLFPTYLAAADGGGVYGMSDTFDYTVPPDGSPSAAYFIESFSGFAAFVGPDWYGWGPPQVNFNNDVSFRTPGDRLVRDGLGAPLVGTNFVAQLYHGPTPDDLRPITNAPAKFRPPTTPTPGTWSGGPCRLPDYRAGDTVWLQVRVWDILRFPTYEGAVAGGGVHAKSCPFTHTFPGGCVPFSEYIMENFPGIPGPPDCSAGWHSWAAADNPPSGDQLLVLAHVNVGVWRATNLDQPSWQVTTNPATLRVPMTNSAEFFLIVRPRPPSGLPKNDPPPDATEP